MNLLARLYNNYVTTTGRTGEWERRPWRALDGSKRGEEVFSSKSRAIKCFFGAANELYPRRDSEVPVWVHRQDRLYARQRILKGG